MTISKRVQKMVLDQAQSDAAYIANRGKMSAHQWGWYHARVVGKPAPSPHLIGLGNGVLRITIYQYYRGYKDFTAE